MTDILLITPPFTQLNTPYPATAYLKGFLNTKGISNYQMDLGIEVILQLFSKKGLSDIFEKATPNIHSASVNAQRIFTMKDLYIAYIQDIIRFLQGQNPSFARQICTENILPKASRFSQLEENDWAFGIMGFQDKAKHYATLFIEDISDFIGECVDENFGFSRYAERLGRSANSFDQLHSYLQKPLTYIDTTTLEILENKVNLLHPKMICFSVPFPGNLYSAFRGAQFLKNSNHEATIVLGGGFPNTELRSISDTRVFNFFDFITLDDGELPIELLFSNIKKLKTNEIDNLPLKRTFFCNNNKVSYNNTSIFKDYAQKAVGTPDYTDLPLKKYISVIEITNPMHSLWSDGRWNKLTMAHGCYWAKCTFCDGSLDYIGRYDPLKATLLVDKIEEILKQTGEIGFHFVDEAAPPALMKALALEIIKRKIVITWWTNVRFEKSFTKDVCYLLQASGCIAVSGGLEVASDRMLKLINKGVTVKQVAQVTDNFTQSGIMVHAYLMYGFPTQTEQETIDSLEMVRQMFELGILQSGFWHQFALTAHSPVGLNSDEFGIIPKQQPVTFANNDIEFYDPTQINHSKFSFGLKKALFNYMHGECFDFPLQQWFDFKIQATKIRSNYILTCLEQNKNEETKPLFSIVWIGLKPKVTKITKQKKGKSREMIKLTFESIDFSHEISLLPLKAQWLVETLEKCSVFQPSKITFADVKESYEIKFDRFTPFWNSNAISMLREIGLLFL